MSVAAARDSREGLSSAGFVSRVACAASGITYRRLDYWARIGLVRPSVVDASGSGSLRLYSFDDLVALRLVSTLSAAGLTLRVARSAMTAFEESSRGRGPEVLVVSAGQAKVVSLGMAAELIAAAGGEVVQMVRLDALRAATASAVESEGL